MCLKSGPRSLQSKHAHVCVHTCVCVSSTQISLRICRTTTMYRIEGLREEMRAESPCSKPSCSAFKHTCLHPGGLHHLPWTRYIPGAEKETHEEQPLLQMSPFNTYSMLKFILASGMCGPTFSDLLSQILNLLYKSLACIINTISSDTAWTLEPLKVFHFPGVGSLSL